MALAVVASPLHHLVEAEPRQGGTEALRVQAHYHQGPRQD